ncbi:MAG: cytochrome c [Aeromonadales bacterium]|nr:cytochrome c [Aeromonadales bacterium]
MSRKKTTPSHNKISSISGNANQEFEPYEPFNPIPWPVIALTLALAVWGIITLLGETLSSDTPSQQATVSNTVENEVNQDNNAQGAELFLAHCSSCHQQNGAGINSAIPPLKNSPYINADPEVAINIILFGIEGEINVAGRTYQGRMPTFGNNLTNKQVAAISQYLHEQWSEEPIAIQPVQVAIERERFATRTRPWAGGDELAAVFNIPHAEQELTPTPSQEDE